MKVTACVVNWNTATHLDAALRSLQAQTHADLELLVVDNASADGSAELVRRHRAVRLVANDVNRGFAGAANQGVAAARANGSDALLLCNPDIRLEPGYVERALAVLAAGRRRAAVQGRLWRTGAGSGGRRVLDTTGHRAFVTRLFRNRGEGQCDLGQYDRSDEVFGVSGAVALYRLAALDDVACDGEVFDEDLFAFWEDVDVDWRLRLRGWQAWYAPQACGWHERGGAGPRRSAVVERLNFANRFLVVLKNDDLGALVRALPGVAATSLLKAGELAVTVPDAFLRAAGHARLVPRMLAKRRAVQAGATTDPAAVVARWFEPFDYVAWVG
ncbi:MAG TPA: glycosyltransferase family 2 protein, partial [Egibacteraceae bacterium]|nr:glycosyltransferase family 2 protein [Egibacteraceae bacterium]